MHRRGTTPPTLFSASARLDADDAPIGMLPREMIAHVMAHLSADREGDLAVSMCVLASRLFHVLDRATLWRRGARLRRLSLVPDRLAGLGFVGALCRLFRRGALTSRALIKAAKRGRTDAVRFLCEVARLTNQTPGALEAAIKASHVPTVAYLLARVPTDARLAEALVVGTFSAALFGHTPAAESHPAGRSTARWSVARLVCEAVRRLPTGQAALYARSATACALLSRVDGAIEWLRDMGAFEPGAALDAALCSGDPALADRAVELVHSVAEPDGTPPQRLVVCATRSLVLPIVKWFAAHESVLSTDWGDLALCAIDQSRYDVLDFVVAHARPRLHDSFDAYLGGASHAPTTTHWRVADHLCRDCHSMIALERAMVARDRAEAADICARRHALGLPCRVERIYQARRFYEASDCAPLQPFGDYRRAHARAFDLSMAQTVGVKVCGTVGYVMSAADMGATDTLDWLLGSGGIAAMCGNTVWTQELSLDAIDILVRHKCLGRRTGALAYLVRGRHWDRIERLCAAYPHSATEAVEVLFDEAVRDADLALIDSIMRVPRTTIKPQHMDAAASRAPLWFVVDLARPWNVRCSAQGLTRAMRRLHGKVLAGLLDDASTLCTPDALDVSTATQKHFWKKAIASAAAAGFVDNAECVRARLGLPLYGARAMNEAAAQNNLPALAALHALGARFTARAFTRAIGKGHTEAVDFLLATRSVEPSTFALVMAIQKGHLAIAQRLFAHGCPYTHAALIVAARHRHTGLVSLLLARHPPKRRTLAKAVRAARDGLETDQGQRLGSDPIVDMLLHCEP
ncbi:Ankyrin repeat domain containing protein [Pandoravirus salinus]|uniref:Ankyrin repeat domain containing protein n=1 Tax=Pandoravirus salinus TaxID=1349410 RepID=S4VY28_9VIRU|nr:ankyrin repeat domain [Pandoravirus salinus]AGO85574.1 Ankyrin repeat domain containing protein [Pandoravirus salinus]